MYALSNRGAWLLGEGLALRPGDIDVVWIYGFGYPWYRGGPMWYADSVGTKRMYDAILDFRKRFGPHWEPAPAPGGAGSDQRNVRQARTTRKGMKNAAMKEPVILAGARTPIGRAFRGAYNMTHGATLAGHVVKHAVERSGVDPRDIEDVVLGVGLPEGATGHNLGRNVGGARRSAGGSCGHDDQSLSAPPGCRPSAWRRNASRSTVRRPWSRAASSRLASCRTI